MALPPFDAGDVKVTFADRAPAVAVPIVGAGGIAGELFVKIASLSDPSVVDCVETQTVLAASITALQSAPELLQPPETQLISPVDEIENFPVPLLDDPLLLADGNVNVPLGLIVAEYLVHSGASIPEIKLLPSHLPAKSACEYEAAFLVKT